MNSSYLNSVIKIILSSKPSSAIRLLLMVLFVSITHLISFGQSSQTFSTPGTYNFTVPAGVTTLNVQAWGSGGGGHNSYNKAGGGGAFAGTNNIIVTPGSIYTITVGAGAGAGNDGADSSFGSLVIAKGGKGGANLGTGGLASASEGAIKFDGGNGGSSIGNGGAGGGGAGGTSGVGASGVGTNNSNGGAGGAGGNIGGGNGGNGGNNSASGSNGSFPGGGGGERGESSGGSSGGGGNGQVIVSWCPTDAGTLSGNQYICTYNTTTTTFASTVLGGTWSSGSTSVATVNSSTGVVTAVSAGTATITYTVASSGCATRTATRIVYVANTQASSLGQISYNGTPYPNTPSPALNFCRGTTSLTFSITGIPGVSGYVWKGDPSWTINPAADGLSATVTFSPTANSNNIEVYASNGCSVTGTQSYIWLTLGSGVPASVNIAASPSGAICSGTSVTFTATPTNGGTTPSYQWKLNGADVGTNSATYANSGLANGNAVTCVMTSDATPCVIGSPATSNTITAIVNATPTITGTVTPATCSNGTDGAITITGLNVPIEFKKADNDHIDLGSKLLSNRNAFTVEGWVKFNLADVGSRMSLFGQNDVVEFFLNTNTIQLYTAGGGSVSTPLTAAIGNNAWHHIAATGDGTNLRIYIDGSLVVTGGTTTTNYGNSTTYNAQIGSGVVDPLTPAGGGFTGQIGKVGFYSTALAAGTISTLATSPTTYLGTETGLIAGYNFFEGSGTALTKLPAGTNGTFGNSPQWAYTSYTWTKTGTPSYTAPTKNISGLSPGDYNLTISTLGGGCPITKTFTVGSTNTTPSTPTVGTTTQPDCVNGGSVVLSGLPAFGTINQTGTVITNYVITGTTMTISGLAAGSYNFAASNGSCSSSATGNVVIIAPTTATWTGSAWVNGPPTASQALEFTGDYNSIGDLTACSCKVTGSKNVVIKSGHSLTITNEVTVVGTGSLTFEDTASLVQINDASVNSGNIIYQRTSASALNSDYTYWSSPVTGQNLSISPSYASGMFYSYNDFAIPVDWKKETSSTEMVVGKGYIIRGPQTSSPPPPPGLYYATFTGVPNNGIKSIAIGPNGTFNLLGNPYPSAINADTFLSTNSALVEGTIYFWTHNTAIQLASSITGVDVFGNPKVGSGALAYTSDDYASYNGTGGVAVSGGGIIPTGKIAAGQAFFTTSKATGASVKFNNAMRLAGTTLADRTGTNQQFFKTKNTAKTTNAIEKDRIWLNLSNDQGAFKQTLVGYITDATNDYDSRFDGESFDGNDFVDFYSINEDKYLTIQGRALPFDENDEVPLGFRSTIEGSFSISIDQVDGSMTNQDIFIEDKLTNSITDLKAGNYTFNTAAGTFNNRFVLRYNSKTLGITDLETQTNKVVVSVKNKQIKINSLSETINKVAIFDLLGRQIYQKNKVDSSEFLTVDFSSSHQALIVKTTLQNGQLVTNKIIF